MPELPEVETIAQGLHKAIAGKRIKEVKAIFPGIVRQNFNLFKKAIIQKRVKGVRRRGKYLLIDLSGGKTILVHLGMTGNFLFIRSADLPHKPSGRCRSESELYDKHDHLIFRFYGSDEQLRYNDQRKFGKIKLFNTAEEKDVVELKKLGPEALEIKFSEFFEIFRRRKRRIKSALLNQHIIAGLGNIYVDESLFEAKIHPAQKAELLSENKLRGLHKAIGKILHKAIKAGGSSVENYLNVDGKIGRFQLQHKVYGREEESCKRCRTKIKRIKINQRSSYFCSKCQPMRD
ncbi:MAG: bifunctional DNA-formamidopyrimidine glycosylase/DNA-(apurinic or apyrimidinic site) lyase [candidate division Zixibacteria bacterium]|nr:bifunctional DNA-formamidopyrimidine glycosylase/DNA-(apurinic or apyrimidinic site) lyase [candidate division Zixibacteria bacterium]